MPNKDEDWFEKTRDIYDRLVDMGEDIKDVADYIFFLDNENKLLKEQIEALKGELKEETPKGEIWKPKEGKYFWYVDQWGEVFASIDKDYVEIGNCYPTEEKAKFEAKREKYTRLFRQYVEQHSKPLDWEDDRQEKWYVYYDYESKIIGYNQKLWMRSMNIYGSSEEVMREAVAFIGEENAKRYILGVEENNGI